MSHLLVDPTATLVVGGSDTQRERVESLLAGGPATEVVTVRSVDTAETRLADRDDIGCVVFLAASGGSHDATDSVAEVHATVRDYSDALPAVVVSDDPAVAAAVATREGCRYLPRSVADERLAETVADALATFDERRRELAESSIFRTLLVESEVPLYAKDERGRHLYKSDLSDDPHSPEGVIGKTDRELEAEGVLDEARDTYADDMRVIESGEGIYDLEERSGMGDDEFWSLTTKVPWREDGEVQGLVGLSFDITRWKERERRLAAEHRRIEQFTRYLAHDLRTPLQVAYGALDAAREGDEAAFEKVEDAHERMQAIVEDLQGLSTSSANLSAAYDAVSVGIASTHLVPLVSDVWESIDAADATLSVELPDDTLVAGRADVLRPVIQTLLRNAVQHGGPGVTVRVGETDRQGFFIADDGPGFPEEVLAALRSDDLDRHEALGPGLVAVLETVEQQGWGLVAGESEGGGARVAIEDCPVVTDTLAEADPGEPVALTENVDVKDVTTPGSATFDAGSDTWRVTAGGRDVWGDTNEFHFVYGTAEPPVRIQGQVTRLDAVDEFSKAGFAVRAGTDERAPFGYVGTTAEHGSETTWRLARDGHTDSHQFEERPDAFSRYRIEYADGVCTCYLGDGEDWRPVDQRRVDLGETAALGLLVCAHDAEKTCEATFESVSACRLDV